MGCGNCEEKLPKITCQPTILGIHVSPILATGRRQPFGGWPMGYHWWPVGYLSANQQSADRVSQGAPPRSYH